MISSSSISSSLDIQLNYFLFSKTAIGSRHLLAQTRSGLCLNPLSIEFFFFYQTPLLMVTHFLCHLSASTVQNAYMYVGWTNWWWQPPTWKSEDVCGCMFARTTPNLEIRADLHHALVCAQIWSQPSHRGIDSHPCFWFSQYYVRVQQSWQPISVFNNVRTLGSWQIRREDVYQTPYYSAPDI